MACFDSSTVSNEGVGFGSVVAGRFSLLLAWMAGTTLTFSTASLNTNPVTPDFSGLCGLYHAHSYARSDVQIATDHGAETARKLPPEGPPPVVEKAGASQSGLWAGLGLRKLMDTPLRDTSICQGPDGTWYLTGTVEPFWGFNEGIKLWKSPDLTNWTALGFVWKYGASPWHKKFLEAKKPLWAPEVHCLKGTFWLTYSMPGWDGTARTSGSGLLKSTTGKPEGPYVDMQPAERMGDEIDASLFEDDNGAVYFLWHSGKIARLKPDMSGLAEPYHWLRTTTSDPDPKHHSGLCAGIFGKDSFDHVGYEGMFLFKRAGRYYLSCSENFDGRYSCSVAMSTNLFGPYGARYEAIPHGGHNVFFQDGKGQWWSTFFGSDGTAPWQERPGILPIRFDESGRLRPE
jgi:beta-xylosidase